MLEVLQSGNVIMLRPIIKISNIEQGIMNVEISKSLHYSIFPGQYSLSLFLNLMTLPPWEKSINRT